LWAIDAGHADVVAILIKAGADVNTREQEFGMTPMMWALGKNQHKIARMLGDAGARQ
jgi:ankyrin repeat protein